MLTFVPMCALVYSSNLMRACVCVHAEHQAATRIRSILIGVRARIVLARMCMAVHSCIYMRRHIQEHTHSMRADMLQAEHRRRLHESAGSKRSSWCRGRQRDSCGSGRSTTARVPMMAPATAPALLPLPLLDGEGGGSPVRSPEILCKVVHMLTDGWVDGWLEGGMEAMGAMGAMGSMERWQGWQEW